MAVCGRTGVTGRDLAATWPRGGGARGRAVAACRSRHPRSAGSAACRRTSTGVAQPPRVLGPGPPSTPIGRSGEVPVTEGTDLSVRRRRVGASTSSDHARRGRPLSPSGSPVSPRQSSAVRVPLQPQEISVASINHARRATAAVAVLAALTVGLTGTAQAGKGSKGQAAEARPRPRPRPPPRRRPRRSSRSTTRSVRRSRNTPRPRRSRSWSPTPAPGGSRARSGERHRPVHHSAPLDQAAPNWSQSAPTRSVATTMPGARSSPRPADSRPGPTTTTSTTSAASPRAGTRRSRAPAGLHRHRGQGGLPRLRRAGRPRLLRERPDHLGALPAGSAQQSFCQGASAVTTDSLTKVRPS